MSIYLEGCAETQPDKKEDNQECTCHPDDWPSHIECQRKYAFTDCAIEAIRNHLAMIK